VAVTVTSGTVTPAPTTVALGASVNPAVVGQAVTLTATVRDPAGSGVPTGTVVFTDGNVILGRGEVQADGTATFTTSFATAGGHAITASYSGDANFAASSQSLTEQVNAPAAAATTTTLQTSIATAVFGQAELLTATVTSPAGVPTGTVTFLDGTTVLGTAQLNAGQAVLPVSLGVGNHQLTAVYEGTAAFAGSTSAAAAVTVNPAATAVTLGSSLNPAVTGQAVTFTATVAAVAPGAGTPSGTVTFKDGTVVLGTFAVRPDGTATFITTFAAAGDHVITAVYNGDANFAGSSQALTEQVNAPVPAATTTALSTSIAAAVFGQTGVLTATVTSPAGTPTGFVTFKDGNTVLGTAPLDANGKATLPVSLGVGSHTLTAAFTGSGGFADSNSAAVGVTVSTASTTVALGSSLNPAVPGQAVTFTATVAAVAPGAGTPTGTVTFKDGTVVLGTFAVRPDGTATFTTSFAVAGGHAITATYSGDANFVGSSQALTEQVNVPATQATTLTLAASANPVRAGRAVTFTATVRGPTGAGTPTGTVTFLVNGRVVARVTLDANGQARLTRSFSRKGLYSIQAVYSGDANFAASSQTLTEQVN
jgi:hypothetical protein